MQNKDGEGAMNGSCWYCKQASDWRFTVRGTGCCWVQEYCHRHAVLVYPSVSPDCELAVRYVGTTPDQVPADAFASLVATH
jgi:hypothetical protein